MKPCFLLFAFCFFYLSQSILHLDKTLEGFCQLNFKNPHLLNYCLKNSRFVGATSQIDKPIFLCATQTILNVTHIYFNMIPTLGTSFNVSLVGSVKANEDLKDVVVGIYYNNSQQNTETISKTDVLDAGNPFTFQYTAFLPSFLSSGNYSIQFTVHNVNSEILGCVGVKFSV